MRPKFEVRTECPHPAATLTGIALKIFTLEKDVYYTPYPTDEEFFGFILNGKVATVVNLMDPKVKEEKMRIDLESKVMKDYNQSFFNLPLSESTTENQVKALVLTIQKLKKPIVIHSYSSESEHAKIFKAAYQKFLKK